MSMRMRANLLCMLLLLASCMQVLCPLTAVAAQPEPGREGETLLISPGGETLFAALSGADHYDLFLNGMQLGGATVDVKEDGGNVATRIVSNVRSVIGSLFGIGYTGRSVMSPEPLQPKEAVIEERKGSKTKTYLLKFLAPNRALAVQTEEKPGRAPKRSQLEFTSRNLALDPFSAIFFVRSLDWQVGDVEIFDVLTGKKQYELRLSCRGETVLSHDGVSREAWEIALESRAVEAPKKVKLSGVIYLARDGSREILKLTGRHRIGRIVAQMRGDEEKATRQSPEEGFKNIRGGAAADALIQPPS